MSKQAKQDWTEELEPGSGSTNRVKKSPPIYASRPVADLGRNQDEKLPRSAFENTTTANKINNYFKTAFILLTPCEDDSSFVILNLPKIPVFFI